MPSLAEKDNVPPKAAEARGALEGLGRVGHRTREAPKISAASPTASDGSLGVPKAVPAPANVTAAAVAAVAARAAPDARTRRRSTFAEAARARTALFFAHRRRRLTALALSDPGPG